MIQKIANDAEHDADVADDEAGDRHAATLLAGLLDLAQRDVARR